MAKATAFTKYIEHHLHAACASLLFLSNCLFVGSYTDTLGLRIIREDVAKYISRRDGYPADPDDVILVNGGAMGIQV